MTSRPVITTLALLIMASGCGGCKDKVDKTEQTGAKATVPKAAEPTDNDPPFSASYLMDLAVIHMDNKAWGRAGRDLKAATALKVDKEQKFRLLMLTGDMHERMGDGAKAKPYFIEAATLRGDEGELARMRLEDLDAVIAGDNPGEAETKLLAMLKDAKTPDQISLLEPRLLEVWRKMDKVDDAIAMLKKRIEEDEADAAALSLLAELHIQVKLQPESALQYYLKLHELHPKTFHYMLMVADTYAGTGQLDKTIKVLEPAYDEFEIDRPLIAGRLASMYAYSRNPAKAIKWGNKLIELEPKSAPTRAQVAENYLMLGKTKDAIRLMNEAVEVAVDDYEKDMMRIQLARQHFILKDTKSAKEILQGVIDKPANESAAKAAMEMLALVKENPKGPPAIEDIPYE